MDKTICNKFIDGTCQLLQTGIRGGVCGHYRPHKFMKTNHQIYTCDKHDFCGGHRYCIVITKEMKAKILRLRIEEASNNVKEIV